MPFAIQIPNNNLIGFSEEARELLKSATADFAIDLIEEANRIEAGRNSTDGPPEVTGGMVNDANLLLRRGLSVPKKACGYEFCELPRRFFHSESEFYMIIPSSNIADTCYYLF